MTSQETGSYTWGYVGLHEGGGQGMQRGKRNRGDKSARMVMGCREGVTPGFLGCGIL